MRVLGVDGCKQGWVGIYLESGRFAEACLYARFDELVAEAEASIIAVDMPIGLLDEGWRECDGAARGFLGPRRSSVFLVPPRPVIEATSYVAANVLCRELTGKGLSKQAYALAGKILEVDAIASDDSGIHEVHPEVSFRVLGGGAPLASKKSWASLLQRQELLEAVRIIVPATVGQAGQAAADDVLDAAVAAWTAARIARGEARSFPPAPSQRRPGGEVIAIWA